MKPGIHSHYFAESYDEAEYTSTEVVSWRRSEPGYAAIKAAAEAAGVSFAAYVKVVAFRIAQQDLGKTSD